MSAVWSGRAWGQGEVLATPQHMAMIAGAVANGGVMMKPVLVKRIENSMGVATHTLETSVYRQAMQPATAELLARAMYETVQSGTASRAAISGYTVCGKTGSAETATINPCPPTPGSWASFAMKASPTPWPWSSNRAARAAPWPRPSAGRRWKRPFRSWDRGEARAFGRILP